jgi:hypothetical protein
MLSTAAHRMVISVTTDLCPIIQGTAITTALSAAQLHSLLGPPSRITEPAVRPPVKHRNNQFHVYDAAGLYFQEHHYTRRIAGCDIVFCPEELSVPFAPSGPYTGQLRLGHQEVSPESDLGEVVRGCGIKFEPSLAGWLVARRDQFSAILTCRGAKLPSGQRSRTLQLVSVALSWPHDPWGTPEGGG